MSLKESIESSVIGNVGRMGSRSTGDGDPGSKRPEWDNGKQRTRVTYVSAQCQVPKDLYVVNT